MNRTRSVREVPARKPELVLWWRLLNCPQESLSLLIIEPLPSLPQVLIGDMAA